MVVVVAASGNTAGLPIFAPARFDAAIAVGATDNRDRIQIQAILEATSIDLGATGFDPIFGQGRVDAFEACV